MLEIKLVSYVSLRFFTFRHSNGTLKLFLAIDVAKMVNKATGSMQDKPPVPSKYFLCSCFFYFFFFYGL